MQEPEYSWQAQDLKKVRDADQTKKLGFYHFGERRIDLMGVGFWLRVIMILTGVSLFGITMVSLAKRKMTDTFVLAWGLVSVIFVLGGILLHPTELERYISGTGMLLVGSVVFFVVFGLYFMSVRISELTRRNLELAMQVTLLRQEVAALEAWTAEGDRPGEEERADSYRYAGARQG